MRHIKLNIAGNNDIQVKKAVDRPFKKKADFT